MEQEKIIKKLTQKSVVEEFEFLKKLGQGAYSTVYKVKRKQDGELYALKKVKMKNLSSKQKQNSLNEVRILASISHQNVVSYKQAFFQAQSLYIVMQYADNGDLFGQINNKKKKQQFYNQQEIWSIFLQIVAGLNTLHNLKIIHRDLKSANIFINKTGEVKLGDMNVSKIGDLCMTQTGTPYYASPQIWKDMPYDSKSDIWSLGCVLYQMITLNPPFQGTDMEDLYKNILLGKFQPLAKHFTQNLKLMIDGLLQKTPLKRPTTQYILENIDQIVPSEFHPNALINMLIKKYSKKYVNPKKAQKKGNMSQLMKTIQFPNLKKHRRMMDSELTSFLPSPSYSKSHRTSKQKSCQITHRQSIKKNVKQKKSKPESLFIPAVNLTLDDKKKKLNRGDSKVKPGKQNKNMSRPSKRVLKQKRSSVQRTVLPAIENKKILHRRYN